jgi:predicted phosphodiesterase
MKLLVLSDLHLEDSGFVPDKAALKRCDAVVLAGDIHPGSKGIAWARKTFGSNRVVYVAGNHEFWGGDWDRTLDELREQARVHDVSFLENDSVVVEGVRFLGCTLWTDFKYFGIGQRSELMHRASMWMPDYSWIKQSKGETRPITPRQTAQRHELSLEWLKRELEVERVGSTVVVTHHLPHKNSCSPEFANDPMTAAFGSKLDVPLIQRANLWIHGHTHSSVNYRLGDSKAYVRVVANPRGVPSHWFDGQFENSRFDPGFRMELLPDGNWGQAV